MLRGTVRTVHCRPGTDIISKRAPSVQRCRAHSSSQSLSGRQSPWPIWRAAVGIVTGCTDVDCGERFHHIPIPLLLPAAAGRRLFRRLYPCIPHFRFFREIHALTETISRCNGRRQEGSVPERLLNHRPVTPAQDKRANDNRRGNN